jgi:hypothetical protein
MSCDCIYYNFKQVYVQLFFKQVLNKLSYMEITKLQIAFLVLHIVFSFLTEDLPQHESRQLLLNCFYALGW